MQHSPQPALYVTNRELAARPEGEAGQASLKQDAARIISAQHDFLINETPNKKP
jgi:hypothetical protein